MTLRMREKGLGAADAMPLPYERVQGCFHAFCEEISQQLKIS